MNKDEIGQAVREVIGAEVNSEYIQRISLFGSFLYGDDSPDSDVDLLLESNETMSLFQTGGLQYRLEQRLGRKVDLVPRDSVIRQLRDIIIPQAEVIYEKRQGSGQA